MKTTRQNTGQEKLFAFSLVYLTGSTPFLTPTYFDIKVLDKYKADPRNYEIQDSEIYYLRDWSIPFCINEEGESCCLVRRSRKNSS